MKQTIEKEGDFTHDSHGLKSSGASQGWSSSRIAKVSGIVVFLAIVVPVGFRLFKQFKPAPPATTQQAVLTVACAPVEYRQIEKHLQIAGTVWAWDPLTIGCEASGLRVESVNVDEGHFVKKGQVLATLNSSVLEAQLLQHKAELAKAKGSLTIAIQPNRPMDIGRLQARVEETKAVVKQEEANIARVKADLEFARSTTVRFRELGKVGAVSQQDLENKESIQKAKEAELVNNEQRLRAANYSRDQAIENLKMAHEGGRKEDIDIAKANVAAEVADVKHTEALIRQTRIQAPCDGYIVKRMIHIGDTVMQNEDCFQMVRDNRLEVRAQVPEPDLGRIKIGQKVLFKSNATPDDKDVVGTIREISPMVDQQTRLATCRIDIPFDIYKKWLPGTFVSGKVNLGAQKVLAVPSTAVLSRDGRAVVFVYQDNRVYQRPVVTGERTEQYIAIESGLKENEQVVTVGGGFLKDNDPVRLSENKQSK
ncbi:MAG: efflux RND transporter periplasmic adaptor subunit [Candidatus Melainabacteria bacterium]|nr:efflux RND transporter periplasmic adaptor subunit [Candidatus Melainabacteria bacterium]